MIILSTALAVLAIVAIAVIFAMIHFAKKPDVPSAEPVRSAVEPVRATETPKPIHTPAPEPIVAPAPAKPAGMTHAEWEALPPSTRAYVPEPGGLVAEVLDARDQAFRAFQRPVTTISPIPSEWGPERLLVKFHAGLYTIAAPQGRGYMIAGGNGGYDARFNGVVGSCTVVGGPDGHLTIEVDKSCEAFLDPI